ncbi:MAG: hypothetical protein JWR86_6 [Enterovirga sp.]|jgi:hypothetical protein|nr:hypothetical protein [Enterovirga sp.]
MDLIARRDWWSTMQIGVFCASIGLLGAIVAGFF